MKHPKVFSGWIHHSAKHFGAVFAVLCAVHCVGFFILTLLGATTLAVLFDNPVIHGWFAGVAAVFVMWDLMAACRSSSRSWQKFIPGVIMTLGLMIMLFSLNVESAHAHQHTHGERHNHREEAHSVLHLLFMGGNLVILGGHLLHKRQCSCNASR